MKYLATTLYFLLFFAGIATAQTVSQVEVKKTARDKAILSFVLTLPDSLKLFSVKPRKADDAFASTLSFEESMGYKVELADLNEAGEAMEISNEVVGERARVFARKISYTIPITLLSDSIMAIKGTLNYLGIKGDEYPNGSVEISAILNDGSGMETNTEAVPHRKEQGWALFFITFLFGFGAVFTPCVFPLMPVTVSFFLKKSKTRGQGITNAWVYALSIVLIYTIPTLLLTLAFGDKFLYQISTHPISNLFFFAIFLVFAISFFGAFEINLPSSWANKSDSAAQKGGLVGIFFMALTLVIVSFSCTGPIIGSLLSETSSQGIGMAPVIGMLGFSIGMALPFGLLALFPSTLKSLPKSGGWLNTVKVFFGFLELALAMKFFSNADLVLHWGILTRPVFLAGWIVLSVLLGFYLLGKLKFSHDSDLEYISVPRLFIAITSFSFAVYMLPGMWGAPLKPLSGLLPPPSTQDFDLDKLQYQLQGSHSAAPVNTSAKPPSKYVDKFHVPFGLTAYYDLEEAKAASKAVNKPIMIDFTGWSCANCRKMENEVWSKPEILERLRNDFILLSLYVDDKTPLPIKEQYINSRGEKIETIGDKNLDYQITKFKFNAQPLYKFMDHEENVYSEIQYGYDGNVARFAAHLDAMKEAHKQRWKP
jgi:thiol:disulfide interchange protein DsbD